MNGAAREALLERRADRARELAHAAEVILLGLDDGEALRLTADVHAFTGPGLRDVSRRAG